MAQSSAQTSPTYRTACGGTIQDPRDHASAIYHGQRYYFCTLACLRLFERDPDPFMAGEIEHPLEDEP